MDARDIIVLGVLQDRDPPGGTQEHPTFDIGMTSWHLTILRWWRPARTIRTDPARLTTLPALRPNWSPDEPDA